MKVGILYYDGFAEFEVVISALLFKKEELITIATEDRVYMCEEKQRLLPDKTIAEIDPEDIDVFIIPGGDPSYLYDNIELKNFITVLNNKNKLIAGICGGTELLARYGILDNKKCTGDSSGIKKEDYNLYEKSTIVNEDVVVDGNIITSMGQAYVEFALEISRKINMFKDEAELKVDYKWLKNIK